MHRTLFLTVSNSQRAYKNLLLNPNGDIKLIAGFSMLKFSFHFRSAYLFVGLLVLSNKVKDSSGCVLCFACTGQLASTLKFELSDVPPSLNSPKSENTVFLTFNGKVLNYST